MITSEKNSRLRTLHLWENYLTPLAEFVEAYPPSS